MGSQNQEIDSLLNPGVAITVTIKFHGRVVREIVGVEFPDFKKVRLQANDLLDRQLHASKILFLLIVEGVNPKQIHRHSPHA